MTKESLVGWWIRSIGNGDGSAALAARRLGPVLLAIGLLGACGGTVHVSTGAGDAGRDALARKDAGGDGGMDGAAVCGNGVVEPGEECDKGIAPGEEGACPEVCESNDPCVTTLLVGRDCQAHCLVGKISNFIDHDGCCPSGGNALADADCEPICGNMVTEPGELCDGDCPTSCNDGIACTSDRLVGAATSCDATCLHDPVTACRDGDGCCPEGCNAQNDADCGAVCGNGVVESGETCDPPSSCPNSCDDADACTDDVQTGSASTCNVVCSHQTITTCSSGDGCCPAGCNANNDSDCSPVCGNGVVESGEECDDGNNRPADGCDPGCHLETPDYTAFRVDWMVLRDPHMFVRVLFSCYDVTDDAPFGSDSVNEQLNASIQGDDDGDGNLDLNLVLVMRPLDQANTYSGPADFYSAICTAPMDGTQCHEDPANPGQSTAYSNQGTGTCLETYSGTTSGYSPAVAATTAPPTCFDTGRLEITLVLSGTRVTLHDSEIAARYDGDPATGLVSGLVRGFISEAEAQNIQVDLGSLGVQPLSDLLQPDACGSGDDRDVGLDGSTVGWWFYLNFTGTVVQWVDQ